MIIGYLDPYGFRVSPDKGRGIRSGFFWGRLEELYGDCSENTATTITVPLCIYMSRLVALPKLLTLISHPKSSDPRCPKT